MDLFPLPKSFFYLEPSITLTYLVIRTICHRKARNYFLPTHSHINKNATMQRGTSPYSNLLITVGETEISSTFYITERIFAPCTQNYFSFWFCPQKY